MNHLFANLKCGPTRLIGACLFAVFAMVLVALVPAEESEWIVRYAGYFFVLAAVLGFLFYTYQFIHSRCAMKVSVRRSELVYGLLSVCVGAWFVFIHTDFDYKIAMDDYSLAATAKSLHETREVSMTVMGKYVGDYFSPQQVVVDKRPWLYPFVVASLHDVFGYSKSHPFAVNAVACVVFLGLVYVFGRQLAGKWAGLLSVLLWGSLPLLSQNATGAGMEMLNLMMLQLVLAIAVAYLNQPDRSLEGMLSLAAVLLTYTRYESGLFVLPVAIVILIGWWRGRCMLLSWGTVCSSLLLIAVALQTKIYSSNATAWELSDGASSPFGLHHLAANLPHALNFFFSGDDTLANSLLLGWIALPALLGFVILLRTELRVYWRNNPAGLVLALFAVFFVIQFALVLSFHAGKIDSRFVSRYSLPFHGMIIMSATALLGYAAVRLAQVPKIALGVVALFILGVTMPVSSKGIYNDSNFVVREFNWLNQLAEEELVVRSLFVDIYSAPWSLDEHTVVNLEAASKKRAHLLFQLDSGNFPAIYVIRRAKYKDHRFQSDHAAFDRIASDFDLQLVAEKSFSPLSLTQVYRIEGARFGSSNKVDE